MAEDQELTEPGESGGSPGDSGVSTGSATPTPSEDQQPSRAAFPTENDERGTPQGPFHGQPHWLPRLTVVMVAMAGVAGTVWTFQQLSWFLAPTFLGFNLVIAAYPIYSKLSHRGLPKWIAGLLMAASLIASVVVFGLAFSWAVSTTVSTVPDYVPRFTELYNQLLHSFRERGIDVDPLQSAGQYMDPSHLVTVGTSLLGSVSGILSAATVAFVTMIMVMADSMGWSERMKVATGTHPRITHALVGFSEGVRRYWLACTLFGLIMAVINGITLKIFNVPLMGVWMFLTFITTFVPSVGFFFAMVPPVITALLMNGWQNALVVMIIYFVTTWVVQGYFQPKVTGNAVGVNITVSFLSLLFWAWVFGPMGAIIALPATQLVKSLVIDADPKARWVNSFISTEAKVTGADPQT